LQAEALGQNYDAAVTRAENVLLPAFDSWRTRGLSDLAPIGVTRGSFDWLVQGLKQQQKYKDVDAHTKRTYDNGTQLFADHILKDGSRAGSKQVGDFTKAFVDAVYAKLLVVESLDAEGNVVRRERRRMAIATMGACRRAWFVMQRAEEAIVPADNPFAKMGLKKLAPGQKKTETPTATWDELLAFREAAVKLGYASLATAALTAWEWLQREEHLFGAFEISHYRPKARPNSVCVVHPKTGEEAWWPLFDETGKELFPELMPELDAIKEQTVGGLVFRRDHGPSPRPSSPPLDDATRGARLFALYREAHHPRGRATRRTVIHFISPWRLYGRCGFRSFRCGAARSRPASVCPPATHLRQAHPQAADSRRPKTPSGANKTSRFVGIAADSLSE